MSSNNLDNTKSQSASSKSSDNIIDEILAETSGESSPKAAPVKSGKTVAGKTPAPGKTAAPGKAPVHKKRRDDRLIFRFDEEEETNTGADKNDDDKGGLIFGGDFPPLKLVDDYDEDDGEPKAKKGIQKIIFSTDESDKAEKEEKKRKAEEEAKRKAEQKAKEEAERRAAAEKAEAEKKRKAEEEAKRKVELEKKRKIEEEAKRKAKEEAKRKAEEEAKRKAEEEAKRKAEEEAKRKAEEEAKRKAEEEAKRKAEEEAKKKAEAEKKQKEEEKRKAEQKAKEEAEKKAAEEKAAAEKAAAEKAEAEKAEAGEKQEPAESPKRKKKRSKKRDAGEGAERAAAIVPLAEAIGIAGAAAAKPVNLPEAEEESDDEDTESDEKELEAEIAAAVKALMAEKSEPENAAKAAEELAKKAEKAEKNAKKQKKRKESETAPMKPMLSIANIIYTAVLFGGMAAAFIFLPRTGISESEQRMLAAFPEFSSDQLASGKYTGGITEFFNDNVPYREEIKRAALQVRNLFGISYNNAEMIGPAVVVTEEPEEEPVLAETEPPVRTAIPEMSAAITEEPEAVETEVPVETSAPVETTVPVTTPVQTTTVQHPNEIAEGVITNGQVVTKLEDGHWWGISLYGGGAGTKYADALNRFKQALGDDVNVYNMVVPTSGEYYLPDIYSAYNASHRKSIDSINEKLDGVIPVPAIDALAAHVSEKIYLRTDHHWQPLGAYYAAKCFAETAGVPFADISTMQKVDIEGYMGTMSGFTKSANLIGDPETFTYYKPSNNYTTYYYNTAYKFDYSLPFFVAMPVSSSYSMFMGGDKKIVRVSTDAGTGRKLVVFKDSYGNAEIPFYFGSFDEIYVCDMRYFDLNAIDFIKFTGATDVLFTMCTFSAVGPNANGLDIALSNPSTVITESAVG